MPHPKGEIRLEGFSSHSRDLLRLLRKAVRKVLEGEGVENADFTITSLSTQRIRALNRRSFGKDRATDVIAFGLPHVGRIVGDVYLCPSVAKKHARELQVPTDEEIVRLAVHGTLHVLGYDHPESENRDESKMWILQERYVSSVFEGDRWN